MVDEIIAKSYPQKTLKEHTEEVLNNFEELKRLGVKLSINISNKDWEVLRLSCFYHDLGKANTFFQKKIGRLKNIGFVNYPEVSHNFLSLFFLENEDEALLNLVALHHWRELPDLNEEEITEIHKDISKYLPKLKEYFNTEFKLKKIFEFKKSLEKVQRYYSKRINGSIDLKKESKFIILLGLLNRIDHSASAGIPVEIEPIDKYEITKNFLTKIKRVSKPWQLVELKDDFKNKNGVIIASTGMGKTEMSLLWSGSQKSFYTLPVRTSVTAMYNRLRKIFGEEMVGLLHSDALSNMFFNEGNFLTDDIFYYYDMAKNLSYPLIVSTADQIFTATLKYLGFEKIYATLSYSKVIVDEIQAYSPQTMAILVHGLKEIASIGGKFLIVTATFPSFLEKELQYEFTITKIPDLKKHNIKLINNSLSDGNILTLISDLHSRGIEKILIVCNTVKKAKELYEVLKNFSPLLLHSRFTRFDRNFKENSVLEERFKGILIATQVIEVSLDIDFDVLITEMAPFDVLVQRMGRVCRRFKSDGEFYPEVPNVYIFTEDVSGVGTIYEKEIVEKSKCFLSDGILSEGEKFRITNELYSEKNIRNTKYWTKFNNALNSISSYSVNNKKEAQEVFRDMTQIEIIPKCLLDIEVQNEKLLKKLMVERGSLRNIIEKVEVKDKVAKLFLMELIKDFMVTIPIYKIEKDRLSSLSDHISKVEIKEFLDNIKVLDYEYNNEVGILYEEEN